jgi:hypothetical protein
MCGRISESIGGKQRGNILAIISTILDQKWKFFSLIFHQKIEFLTNFPNPVMSQ